MLNLQQSFGHITDLKQHTKKFHEKEKEFSCLICDKRFGLKSNMERRTLAVHGHVKNFCCLQCNKSFGYFFLKGAQVGGRTWDLFDFRLFSITRSALDHSATAPPKSFGYKSVLASHIDNVNKKLN